MLLAPAGELPQVQRVRLVCQAVWALRVPDRCRTRIRSASGMTETQDHLSSHHHHNLNTHRSLGAKQLPGPGAGGGYGGDGGECVGGEEHAGRECPD